MKKWELEYKNHKIVIVNSWFDGEKLYVDGELQDEHIGFAVRSTLTGRIKSGQGEGERIKVSMGGWFAAHCRVFIDDSLVLSK